MSHNPVTRLKKFARAHSLNVAPSAFGLFDTRIPTSNMESLRFSPCNRFDLLRRDVRKPITSYGWAGVDRAKTKIDVLNL